jgi:uncharacterized protein YoxC
MTLEAFIGLTALLLTLITAAVQGLAHSREKLRDQVRAAEAETIKAQTAQLVRHEERIHAAELVSKGLEGQVEVARAEHKSITQVVERLASSIDERVTRIEGKIDELLSNDGARRRTSKKV